MFIRRIKSHNSICFQIGRKRFGQFVLIKHIGCGITAQEVAVLRVKAEQELEKLRLGNQLPLLPQTSEASPPSKALLLSLKITGYHRVFGAIYDRIGFPKGLLRDLVIARIVHPASKSSTVRYSNRYLGLALTKDAVFRFLDTLDKDELVKIAFDFVAAKNQSLTLIFYDVTTLSFETEKEDGLRQKGYSKDHRHDLPQILLGLLVDRDGYPFDFDFFTGKTFEGHTFVKAVTTLLSKYSLKDLTVVADAGMLSSDNLDFLERSNLRFIVGARLKNLAAEITAKILSHDFGAENPFSLDLENRKILVAYSSDRAKKDKYLRENLVAKLRKRLEARSPVIKKSKYLKWTEGSSRDGLILDKEAALADAKFDGLKGYLTNVDTRKCPAEETIRRYHDLWQVERSFRMSKSDLCARPIFHRLEKRIKSHLVICFVSLLVLRETERILKTSGYSISLALELLGKVVEGRVRVGKVELSTESDLDLSTKSLLELFEGH